MTVPRAFSLFEMAGLSLGRLGRELIFQNLSCFWSLEKFLHQQKLFQLGDFFGRLASLKKSFWIKHGYIDIAKALALLS
ncbi:MAG: hypothetical protein VX249_04905, partial [Pseudomonadota bacterium]|nr:hypothetical protein [Pseudomonadota bacterium]